MYQSSWANGNAKPVFLRYIGNSNKVSDMRESFEEFLLRLRGDRSILQSGEQATKQGVILPILSHLGWDRDNIREVTPEFPVDNRLIDYCLKVGEKKAVFIEVKRTGEELERHQEQLLEYAFRDGVELAVLTNGLSWWLYLPLLKGSWKQRKFFVIDVEQQEVSFAARHFREFLARDAVASGSAINGAQAIHASRERKRVIEETIPNAWKQLCQKPDELLLELFAEKVESICGGHRPTEEELAEYLATMIPPEISVSLPPTKPPPLKPQPAKPQSGDVHEALYTNKRPMAYTFRGQRHSVSTFKEILIGLCELLYRLHGTKFERVLELREHLGKFRTRRGVRIAICTRVRRRGSGLAITHPYLILPSCHGSLNSLTFPAARS